METLSSVEDPLKLPPRATRSVPVWGPNGLLFTPSSPAAQLSQ